MEVAAVVTPLASHLTMAATAFPQFTEWCHFKCSNKGRRWSPDLASLAERSADERRPYIPLHRSGSRGESRPRPPRIGSPLERGGATCLARSLAMAGATGCGRALAARTILGPGISKTRLDFILTDIGGHAALQARPPKPAFAKVLAQPARARHIPPPSPSTRVDTDAAKHLA